MRILVTAGNTQTPIDRVRCITNIFSGRTGTNIARESQRRGHYVTLLTSRPEIATDLSPGESDHCDVRTYQTFEDLEELIAEALMNERYDAVVHCAAVSDFHVAGVYAPARTTKFNIDCNCWESPAGAASLDDVHAGKVKSQHHELWLRLTPTPKLIDRIRTDWAFDGILCKFKLEVDVTDGELVEIAEASCQASGADLICANTLAGMHSWALIGSPVGSIRRVDRDCLAQTLINEIEVRVSQLHERDGRPFRQHHREPACAVRAAALA
jgi:phosphopantothenate-cysteine ligase/phosphopantothenoylcysteine decarboxylase/phosphopantothenate--cysteine ligase